MSKTEKLKNKIINKFNQNMPETFYEESINDYYQQRLRAFSETQKSSEKIYAKDIINEQSKENLDINELPYLNNEKTQNNKTITVCSLKKRIRELSSELNKLRNNSNVKNYNILELDYKLKTREITRLKQANNIYRFQINENKRDKYNFYKTFYNKSSYNTKKLSHKKANKNYKYNIINNFLTIKQKPEKTIYSEHHSPKMNQTNKISEKNELKKKSNFTKNLSKNLSTSFQIINKIEIEKNISTYKKKCEEYKNIIDEKNNIIQNFERNINKLEEMNKTINNALNNRNKQIDELKLKIKILKQEIKESNAKINKENNDKAKSNMAIKLTSLEAINQNNHKSTKDFFSNMSLNQNDFQKKKIFFLLNEISDNFAKGEEYINHINIIDSKAKQLLLANYKNNIKIIVDLSSMFREMTGIEDIKNKENNIKKVDIEKYIAQIKNNYNNDNNNTQESNGESNLNNANNQLNTKTEIKKVSNDKNDNELNDNNNKQDNNEDHEEHTIIKESDLKINSESNSKNSEDNENSDGSQYNSNLIILGSEESKHSFNSNLSQSSINEDKKKNFDKAASKILNMRKNSSDISMTDHKEIRITHKKIKKQIGKKKNKLEKNQNKINIKTLPEKKSEKEKNNSGNDINQKKSENHSGLYDKFSSNEQLLVNSEGEEEEDNEREEEIYSSS